MTRLATSRDSNVRSVFAKASKGKARTALSPLTLRLTPEERSRLEELAAGMTLSAYVRPASLRRMPSCADPACGSGRG